MRISGQRADGALHLSLGGGVAVILKGGCVTPTLDETVVDAMGPWEPAANEYTERRAVERRLDNAKLAGMEFFELGGAGSGNFGHSGRPGQEGGSGGGGGKSTDEKHAAMAAKHGQRSADAWKAAAERGDHGEDKESRTIAHLEKVDTQGMSSSERKAHEQSISDAKWRKSQFEHAGRPSGPGGSTSSTLENRWAEPTDTGYSTKERAAYRATQEARKGEDYGGSTTLEHKKNPQSGNYTHKGRAGARGGSLSEAFVETIVNAAKAAAAWKESGTSEAMRANIARNAIYRQTIPNLNLGVGIDHVTDEHLFDLTEQMSGDDLLILAAAFGLSESDKKQGAEAGGAAGGGGKGGGGPVKDTQEGLSESSFGEELPEGEAVALDKYHSLEDDEDKKKEPVSEIAKAAQGDETQPALPSGEVMNLPPAVIVADPAEERKKRRMALLEKVRKAARSKGRAADTLESEEISDEDLFAMAKELGVTVEETPEAVSLMDNATKFSRLLASTDHAKHLAAGGEHPFQYCIDNVVPAMEREGKGPDDPEAFCAYWKAEHA